MALTDYAVTADRLSTRIVDAVADAAGTDPLTLEPRLYDVVDVEALTTLVGSDTGVAIEFDYGGHDVRVRSDGSVAVDGTAFEGRDP
jgi:hypothetical protein